MGNSGQDGFLAKRFLEHAGHAVELVTYGDPPVNVAVECVECMTVLMDFDVPTEVEPEIEED